MAGSAEGAAEGVGRSCCGRGRQQAMCACRRCRRSGPERIEREREHEGEREKRESKRKREKKRERESESESEVE
eukprot:5969318-Pleurochrysis_carterae.AAC.2